MKPLLFLMLLLTAAPISAQRYRVSWKKVGVWAAYGVAGSFSAGREALHADPYSLQREFGGPDDSFIGPDQWLRQYYGRDPERGHKINLFNPLRDYWHFSHAASRTLWIGGAFVIGRSKQPWKQRAIDMGIGLVASSVCSWGTYNYLRR